jgi:hypothetical protein
MVHTTTSPSPPTNKMLELATSINVDNTALHSALASALQPRFFSSIELLELAASLKLEGFPSLDLSSQN